MGLLTPSNKERLLLQRQFEEKCRMIGVEGFYYEVKDLNLSLTSKWDNIHFFEPIKINFLFEDMPNPKTLRNLHWWDDNDDSTPPIAYLPWHVNKDAEHSNYELKPTVGSKIELPDPLGGDSRFYEIVEVNANTIYLIYSIVKLTPLRYSTAAETINVVPVVDTDGSYEHQVQDEPSQVTDPHTAEHMETEEAPSQQDETLSPGSTDYQIINKPEPKEESKRPDSGYTFLNVDGRLKR